MDKEYETTRSSIENKNNSPRVEIASNGSEKPMTDVVGSSPQTAQDPSKKKKRELSDAERKRKRMARRANRYPNSPEAKALAEAEPSMPEGLRKTIGISEKRDQWEEAFDWLTIEMRSKARDGTSWHGKRLCQAILDANPAVELDEAEKQWLVAWIGYLASFKKELRSGGKYGPNTDVLKALGIADEADLVFDQIEALDHVVADKPPLESKPQPRPISPEQAAPAARADGSQNEISQQQLGPGITSVCSIQDLPPPPRTLPFMYLNLTSSTAKEFWRVYRQSDSLGAILTTGRTFALDSRAVNEVRDLGFKASTFLDETMLKLGIPLS